jgi:hypothetical protein
MNADREKSWTFCLPPFVCDFACCMFLDRSVVRSNLLAKASGFGKWFPQGEGRYCNHCCCLCCGSGGTSGGSSTSAKGEYFG